MPSGGNCWRNALDSSGKSTGVPRMLLEDDAADRSQHAGGIPHADLQAVCAVGAQPPFPRCERLLRPLALPLSACAEATVGAPAGATELEQQQAWRTLPKLELFARELRPGWHSAGNEVLRFQHESFWEAR